MSDVDITLTGPRGGQQVAARILRAGGQSVVYSRLSGPMDRVGFYLAYIYLMRVPILAWIILVVFPVASVPTGAPLGSLLRGIFDLSSGSLYLTALSLGTVAFFGLLSGVAIGVSRAPDSLRWRSSIRSWTHPTRSRDQMVVQGCPTFCSTSSHRVLCLGNLFRSNTHWLSGLRGGVGVVLGVAAFFFVMGPIHDALWRLVIERADERAIDQVPPNFVLDRLASLATLALSVAKRVVRLSPAGYVKSPTEELWNRHSFAVIQFVISLGLYLIVFVSKTGTAADLSTPTFPTLCLLLILFMLVCLTLSALSFFLDRYRIPLLTLVVLFGALSAILPQGDHFYYYLLTT